MSDPRLPMTVIGGYLGAGKTTLINRLLTDPQGKRLMVLVNDFGAVNIDAELLQSADEDTLTLTNGCVCCTMGTDLFMAIADVLKRSPRPDHLIVEASGIADPSKIANAAMAEPEMRYGGIVAVADANEFPALSHDPLIGLQLNAQISCADVVLVSKASSVSSGLSQILKAINPSEPTLVCDAEIISNLILSDYGGKLPEASTPAHPAYTSWGCTDEKSLGLQELKELLAIRPRGLFRFKGFVKGPDGQGWLVQVVGNNTEITTNAAPEQTSVVGIGLSNRLTFSECQAWWNTGR